MRLGGPLLLAALLSSGAGAEEGIVRTVGSHLVHDVRAQAQPGDLLVLGLAGVGALAASTNDRQVRSSTLDSLPFSLDASRAASWVGNGYVLAPAVGVSFLAGRFFHAPSFADFGEQGVEAMAVSGLEVEVLKLTVRRERPDGSDPYSFPSGHSAAAFSVATAAAETWGWKAGVPAFLAAAFIGYSRLELDKHYLSDVVFGAGLGISAGRAVALSHRARADSWAWAPVLLPGGAGFAYAF